MNAVQRQLVLKDWYFVRWPMFAYALLAGIALVLLTIEKPIAFYTGIVVLLSTVVVIGIHIIFNSITHERSKQTLPFILSLPVSFMQYTRSKIAANMGLFLIFWTGLTVLTMFVIAGKESIPNGFMPYALIMLGELLAAFTLLLAVALISESEAWTVVVMSISNVGISIFAFWLGQVPGIAAHSGGATAVWNSTALTILTVEALLVAGLIGLTLFIQSRKTDFI